VTCLCVHAHPVHGAGGAALRQAQGSGARGLGAAHLEGAGQGGGGVKQESMEPLQRFLLGGMAAMTEDERRQIRTWLIVPGSLPEVAAVDSSPPSMAREMAAREARLSSRTYQTLKRCGYRLVDAIDASDAELCALRNFGVHCLREVRAALDQPVPDSTPPLSAVIAWDPVVRITDQEDFLACFVAGGTCWQVAQKYGYHADGPARGLLRRILYDDACAAAGPRPQGYGVDWHVWRGRVDAALDDDPRRLWLER
jgi:hypothetical protein